MFLQSIFTDVTDDPSIATLGHSGGQVGQGAGHLPLDLSHVL